jgi:hypothetical protein
MTSPAFASSNSRWIEIAKSVYHVDHQSKFLTLHADTESLLQQLQTLKHERGANVYHQNQN